MSSFVPPSMASGVTRPPSHFWTSLDQLRTRLEGETTITLSISGLKSGLWRSRVHMRVMHCRVFPRPISSAMMHPYDPGILLPVTHSHKNFTPWRKQRNIKPTRSIANMSRSTCWIGILSWFRHYSAHGACKMSVKVRKTDVEYLSLVRSEHLS